MTHKANIQIINKKTGKENKALTHKFLKSINTYEKFEFPNHYKISIS
ncbi:hypothetical protein [Paenibacillus sp. ISL-20]|nr:hypothetical protein [Paenibacillus sp. ISL-20]MBT2759966.1 hypothetical protein [Paenibacillus sp. ISL-20]